jgi:TolB-like protein
VTALVRLVAALGIALVASASAAESARVVILPVVVHSATSDSAYVSQGLADMLSARLEQIGGVDVVLSDDSAAATSQLPRAVELGRGQGGDYVVFGSFTQFGDGASLDLRCAPLDQGERPPRTIFVQSGTMGEIIPKLDELANKIAQYVSGELQAQSAANPVRAEGVAVSELRSRVEALERAVFPPISEPPEPADTEGSEETAAEGSEAPES